MPVDRRAPNGLRSAERGRLPLNIDTFAMDNRSPSGERDYLRHSSLATTSMYLHADDARRAKQLAARFAAPKA